MNFQEHLAARICLMCFLWGVIRPLTTYANQAPSQPRRCQQAEAEVEQGRQLLKQQKFEEAIQEFRSARKRCATNITILPGLARAYIGAGEFPLAEQTAREFEAKNSTSIEGQFLLGYTYFLEQRFRNAAETLQLLLHQDPRDSDALRVMGMTLFFMGDYRNAIRALTDDLKIRPNDQEALYFLGSVYYAEHRLPKALDSFLRLSKLNPKSYQAYDYLGLCYRGLGRTAQAIESFRKSESLSKRTGPPYDAPFTHLAGLLIDNQRYDEAVPSAQAALRIDPSSAVNQYLMGNLFYHSGDLGSALTLLNRSTTINRNLAQPHYLLGRIYFRLGQKQRAQEEFSIFGELTEHAREAAKTSRQSIAH